jgi:hypothetical protein
MRKTENKYFVDIEHISLARYRNMLENSDLLPGRKMLYENIRERFERLEQQGIRNLKELVQALKSENKIKDLADKTDIPAEYLTILRREMNRLLPKPVSIADFPGVEASITETLKTINIKNTLQLFEQCDTTKKRAELADQLNIPLSTLEELTRLADLSRIWGVGPVFCRIFLDAGIDSVWKLSKLSAEDAYEKLVETNKSGNYTRVTFTVMDVALCIKIARELPGTIEF